MFFKIFFSFLTSDWTVEHTEANCRQDLRKWRLHQENRQPWHSRPSLQVQWARHDSSNRNCFRFEVWCSAACSAGSHRGVRTWCGHHQKIHFQNWKAGEKGMQDRRGAAAAGVQEKRDLHDERREEEAEGEISAQLGSQLLPVPEIIANLCLVASDNKFHRKKLFLFNFCFYYLKIFKKNVSLQKKLNYRMKKNCARVYHYGMISGIIMK